MKRKILEIKSLFAAGYGGQIRRGFGTVLVPPTDGGGVRHATWKARPSTSLWD